MFVPTAENAVADIRKLRDYCLDLNRDEGKHKARMFLSALGLTANDAEELRAVLLEVIKTHSATLGKSDGFGQRYTIDFECERHGRRAIVRSSWIIEHDANTTGLTTCYPL